MAIAYLFFYNYDLTELFGSIPTFPNQPNNTDTHCNNSRFDNITNPTPYPSPIPDPDQQNQQNIYTNLTYPTLFNYSTNNCNHYLMAQSVTPKTFHN